MVTDTVNLILLDFKTIAMVLETIHSQCRYFGLAQNIQSAGLLREWELITVI